MRRTDEPLDPEMVAELEAIDAVLAGEAVDPAHAELAELALLVAAERAPVEPAFAAELDERVERRFAARSVPPPVRAVAGRRAWSFGQLAGLASAGVAAVVVAVVIASGGSVNRTGGEIRTLSTTAPSSPTPPSSPTAASAKGAASAGAAAPGRTSSGGGALNLDAQSAASSQAARAPAASAGVGSAVPAPRPPSNGRKLIQSANLELSTTPGHIDAVAQELFDVVGRENGVVNRSTVTAASQGYAQFDLSIPSGNLSDTMTALSALHFANVDSRTDSTQDVNGQYVNAGRRLDDDRALRTSLLKRLGVATTQTEIDSLKAQIRDAENAIARDEAAIRSLNHRIDYSQLEVTVNGAGIPRVQKHVSGGFTLGKAAHDAGRVLTVVAGVGLITLAALVPVLLIGALAWWIGITLRRRRREQALDMA